MAFGTMSADLFESASNWSPEPAVLFYAADDDRAGREVERLIRTAGFDPVKIGGIEQSGRLEVGGDLHRSLTSDTSCRPESATSPSTAASSPVPAPAGHAPHHRSQRDRNDSSSPQRSDRTGTALLMVT
jgi:hypothetical protein